MTNWKNKLLAFLHDPPSKVFDIPAHEAMAQTLLRQAGFTEEESQDFNRKADWAASAADRLPFPSSQASGVRCHFDGVRNCFHHPLGAKPERPALTLPFQGEFVTSDLAHETDQTIQPCLTGFGSILDDASNPAGQYWRARFFAHWRLYQKHAAERDYRFAFLPADTRLPDHTIWTHMQIVSALAGCVPGTNPAAPPKPAFLKLQIGGVQEFIAQARSTRDLWSGSYLLSWLMAAGLKALSAQVGPDAVIFPSLRSQPLFDLHWRDDLWRQVSIGGHNVWDSLKYEPATLLVPNLPNVLLAVVPAEQAAALGARVEAVIKQELQRIAHKVWQFCDEAGMFEADGNVFPKESRKARFDNQVNRFLSISWQVTPWPESLEDALACAQIFSSEMPIQKARQRVQEVITMAEKLLPETHRDRRYYTDDTKTRLYNVGLGWSIILALNGWQLDAVRQTRCFEACNDGGWRVGVFNNKDCLNGRDEAVAGGEKWASLAAKKGKPWSNLFKHEDWVGAMTLIKRLWHSAYLRDVWGLKTDHGDFRMPNTRGIAGHEPFQDDSDDETAEEAPASEKYFAVLALDGDNIGKWVSGESTPQFDAQLADYGDASGTQKQGVREYFQRTAPQLLTTRRPLSPSYHLQFSETLSNFSLLCAQPIVEAFDGRLIYAGGDDVLALVPADSAVACAQALRAAFTGRADLAALLRQHGKTSPLRVYESRSGTAHEGFLLRDDCTDQSGRAIPFTVPGPAADCSIGIAMAHFKAPLQDVVREAQSAQKRAKTDHGKSALGVTLVKRSGEILKWGCQWESGGLEMYDALAQALEKDHLSGKAPHRFAELLTPYLSRSTPLLQSTGAVGDDEHFEKLAGEIIGCDFKTVLARQRGRNYPGLDDLNEKLTPLLERYLRHPSNTSLEKKLHSVIGLCQSIAFARRTSEAPVGQESSIRTPQLL